MYKGPMENDKNGVSRIFVNKRIVSKKELVAQSPTQISLHNSFALRKTACHLGLRSKYRIKNIKTKIESEQRESSRVSRHFSMD
jgi:hypothetical protein